MRCKRTGEIEWHLTKRKTSTYKALVVAFKKKKLMTFSRIQDAGRTLIEVISIVTDLKKSKTVDSNYNKQ